MKIIYIVFLLVMLVPLLEQQVQCFKKIRISGYFVETQKPEFTKEAFLALKYQEQFEKYLSENFGFRNNLFLLRNQIYFSVFNQSPNIEYSIGENGYLYENKYIQAHYGNNFAGDTLFDDLTSDIKRLQDTLANHHVLLLTVVAPSKADVFPEYLPSSFDLTPDDMRTNYNSFSRFAKDKKLNFMDFNEYFSKLKSTSPFPIYTKNGTHWSFYAATIAFDTILKKMTELTGKPFPQMKYHSAEVETNKNCSDYDIARTFNLIHTPDNEPVLLTPNVEFKIKAGFVPNVLGVTDSYYGILDELDLLKNCFKSPDYWFGYQLKFPNLKYDTLKNKDSFLYHELLSHDVIVLMSTHPNLQRLGWGFIQDALKLFNKDTAVVPYRYDFNRIVKVEDEKDYLSHNVEWFQKILQQAKENNRNTDEYFDWYAKWHAAGGK